MTTTAPLDPAAFSEGSQPDIAPRDEEESSCRPWQLRFAHFFMILVMLRLPFFEVPCPKGTCRTPVEIVAAELYSYNRCPHVIIKSLLFPGALGQIFQGMLFSAPLPENATWQHLLGDYRKVPMKEAYQQPLPQNWEMFKEQQIDLIGGSFIVVLGALMSFFGPFMAGSLGMVLLYLYVLREELHSRSFMAAAAACSLAWIPLHRLVETPAEKTHVHTQHRALKTKGKFKVY